VQPAGGRRTGGLVTSPRAAAAHRRPSRRRGPRYWTIIGSGCRDRCGGSGDRGRYPDRRRAYLRRHLGGRNRLVVAAGTPNSRSMQAGRKPIDKLRRAPAAGGARQAPAPHSSASATQQVERDEQRPAGLGATGGPSGSRPLCFAFRSSISLGETRAQQRPPPDRRLSQRRRTIGSRPARAQRQISQPHPGLRRSRADHLGLAGGRGGGHRCAAHVSPRARPRENRLLRRHDQGSARRRGLPHATTRTASSTSRSCSVRGPRSRLASRTSGSHLPEASHDITAALLLRAGTTGRSGARGRARMCADDRFSQLRIGFLHDRDGDGTVIMSCLLYPGCSAALVMSVLRPVSMFVRGLRYQ
jgi:hypothetical protein